MSTNSQIGMQLGANPSTAKSRLYKQTLFRLANDAGQAVCYRCSKLINTLDEFSIDHKEPWLHKPNAAELFFDQSNIAFSHTKCNSRHHRNIAASNASGFRGVWVDNSKNRNKPYLVGLLVDGRKINLGRFECPKEAAAVYDRAAVKAFGELAITNASLGLI